MKTQQVQRLLFQIHSETDRSFISVPSRYAVDLFGHLRSHGIRTRYPLPVILGVHRLEIPSDSDPSAVKLLVDLWVEAHTASPAGRNARAASSSTLYNR